MSKSNNSDFFLLFCLNLAWHSPWVLVMAAIVILHFVLGLDLAWLLIPLALWILGALLYTGLISWGRWGRETEIRPGRNINPYSAQVVNPYSQKKNE